MNRVRECSEKTDLKTAVNIVVDYQWLHFGFFKLKMDLSHTVLQLIIPLINVLSAYKSQS